MSERIAPGVRAYLAGEISAAGGREVPSSLESIVTGWLPTPGWRARGTVDMVLALPGGACRGEMLLHNHPSGCSTLRPPISMSRLACTTPAWVSGS